MYNFVGTYCACETLEMSIQYNILSRYISYYLIITTEGHDEHNIV